MQNQISPHEISRARKVNIGCLILNSKEGRKNIRNVENYQGSTPLVFENQCFPFGEVILRHLFTSVGVRNKMLTRVELLQNN